MGYLNQLAAHNAPKDERAEPAVGDEARLKVAPLGHVHGAYLPRKMRGCGARADKERPGKATIVSSSGHPANSGHRKSRQYGGCALPQEQRRGFEAKLSIVLSPKSHQPAKMGGGQSEGVLAEEDDGGEQ